MFSVKQIGDYVSFHELICTDCEKPVRIKRIGVAVGGYLVVEIECEDCKITEDVALVYDDLLSASQRKLIEAIRS